MDASLSEHPDGPLKALDRHLAQWEWSSVSGRLDREYGPLLAASFKDAPGYVNDAALYASAERKLLNEARTCYITRPMMMVAMQSAGIEFTKSDTDLVFTRRDLDPKYVAADWSKAMDMHLGNNHPTLTTEMIPRDQGLLLMEPGMFYADYDKPVVEEFGGESLGYVEIYAIGWQYVNDVSSSHGNGVPGVVLYVYVKPHPLVAEMWVNNYGSAPPMHMLDFSGWAFNEPWDIGGWEMPKVLDTAELRPHVACLRMFMAAAWALMMGYIDPMRPPRRQARKMKRLKMPEDGDISVIHLRKFLQLAKRKTTAQDYDEDGDPTWSHRWIVGPHWAWRACKCHEEGRHRVHIDAYIKGPEHLPLVIKEKVLSLDR